MVKVSKDNSMHISTNRQSGVAAIFVVVFFTLLISIIVISFVQIVNQDQQQATNSDLYSSAYDSAQAGVEDAKRALQLYQNDCVKTTSPDCATDFNSSTGALSGVSCSSLQGNTNISNKLGLDVDPTNGEVKIAATNNTNDRNLDQAYTCLKVTLQTDDYKASMGNGSTILVPLKAIGDVAPNAIHINWFDKSQAAANIGSQISNFNLPKNSNDWGNNNPPIIRAQIIAVKQGGGIDMQAIDDTSKVVFLYPSTAASGAPVDVTSVDATRTTSKYSPIAVKCDPLKTYACGVDLTNFAPGVGSYDYYLRLTTIYNGANVQVQMMNDTATGTVFKFDAVEPEIDSTGRANDVYRRVVSRVAFTGDNSGIDVTQGICKAFQLADLAGSYSSASCSQPCLVDESIACPPPPTL